MRIRLTLSVMILLAGGLPVRSEPVQFDRDVAPILVNWCTDCHSGKKPRGSLDLTRAETAGGTITAGNLAQSLFWRVIDLEKMPPKKKLPASARATLKAWIEQGAKWGTDPIDPLAITTTHRAGKNWWSLRPLAAPKDHNTIDGFVQSRLEKIGKRIAPEADRRTLLRRLSFDLTGLPPTFAEVEAFVADTRPDAYERQVDRLLASSAHGERWARHWLDLVRYGESNGFERDLPRTTAWPYRDWVIDAFNRDLPYDEFARMQLAGDVLRPGDPDGLRATGYLVAGAHDTVVPSAERMRKTMQQDELEDLLGSIGQTFLGLTINCARCHDHKFDPVTARDYYALAAIFGGVDPGEKPLPRLSPGARLAELTRREQQIRTDLARLEAPARTAALARRQKEQKPAPSPEPLAEWDLTESLRDQRGGLHLTLTRPARRDEQGLHLDGQGYATSASLAVELREKTLEAWVKLTTLDQSSGGVLTVQTLDGRIFDSIVFAEREPGRWMAGSDFFRRTRDARGVVEKDAQRAFVHVAITYASDGTITLYRNGEAYGQAYRSGVPIAFEKGEAQVVLGLRHLPAGGNKHLRGVIQRARLYDRALSAAEVAASAGRASDFVSEAELLAALSPQSRAARSGLLKQRAEAERERTALSRRPAGKVYTAVARPLDSTHVLLRGDVSTPGDLVAPAAPSAVRVPGFTQVLSAQASEGERRAWFAKWLTDPTNPLFPRVLVNRLWQYHLGFGLIETASDLGFHGGQPTDPALLDWLARKFIDSGYRLKPLHRLIVTSRTYRQAATAERPLPWAVPALHRLDAESIRDAMLASAGLLDRTMGGPGYLDVKSYFFKGTQFYDPIEQVGPAFHRRTVYRFSPRGGRTPWLETFDCPDPSTATPRRARTTTPLQALAQLNNAFVFYTAEQMERTIGKDGTPTERVTALYQRLVQRSPRREEIATVLPFVERHGLAALARVLLNSNEFLHVE